ncbi:SCO family protein [Tessaracoccus caeni]|uniref:SCO family protein n=1 Tax=Tessaracoccus caeni TaxID=3031239 RepID=UPI0023DA3795|nr:SCO family protein [Tessaracoccus caeni]MDF1489437.1 SCO family protein [Tessaracoccus caeni]
MISRRVILAGAGVSLVFSGCASGNDEPVALVEKGDDFKGTRVEDGRALPEVVLTDQNGQEFNLATSPTTPVVMVFFGYTNCPDVCPGILADMATARRRLDPADAEKVSLILVTTDPARDTPEALGEYLVRVDEGFIGLTGPLEDIVAAGEQVGIAVDKGKELPSGGYEVDHSTQVLAFDDNRRMAMVWSQPSIADMRDDLQHLLADLG